MHIFPPSSRAWRALLATVALTGVAAAPSPAAASAGGAHAEHCVAHVETQRADGELVVGPLDCYSKFSDAMASIGVTDASSMSGPEDFTAEASSASSFILGVHYDGSGFTSSSISVTGADCAGGWLNLTSTWRNRISSTSNGCYRIRHFDGPDLVGVWEDTVNTGGNLTSALNNKSESLQYLS